MELENRNPSTVLNMDRQDDPAVGKNDDTSNKSEAKDALLTAQHQRDQQQIKLKRTMKTNQNERRKKMHVSNGSAV
jgi:hypothetical protein